SPTEPARLHVRLLQAEALAAQDDADPAAPEVTAGRRAHLDARGVRLVVVMPAAAGAVLRSGHPIHDLGRPSAECEGHVDLVRVQKLAFGRLGELELAQGRARGDAP